MKLRLNNFFLIIYLVYGTYFIPFNLKSVFGTDFFFIIFSDYIFLFFLIIHRLIFTLNRFSVSKKTFFSISILILIVLLELYNSNFNGLFIKDSFSKSILFSPFFMNLINFTLLFRNISDFNLKRSFVKYFIKFLKFFLFFQLFLVFSIKLNLLPISFDGMFSLTNDNLGALNLSALALIYFSKEKLLFKDYGMIFLIIFFAYMVNCRSVVLLVFIATLYRTFTKNNYQQKFKIKKKTVIIISSIVLILFSSIFYNSRNQINDLLNFTKENKEMLISDDLDVIGEVENINAQTYNDVGEADFSSFSRLGVNIVSIYYLSERPFFGLGQKLSYSIKFLGNGIHSSFFLIPAFGGILLTFLIYLLWKINFKSVNHNFYDLIGLFFALFFLNSFKPYFLLFFLNDKNDK